MAREASAGCCTSYILCCAVTANKKNRLKYKTESQTKHIELFGKKELTKQAVFSIIIKPSEMTAFYPGVAQLVARLTGGQEAACSSHVTRTKKTNDF